MATAIRLPALVRIFAAIFLNVFMPLFRSARCLFDLPERSIALYLVLKMGGMRMRQLGVLLTIGGLVWLVIAFNMDTSLAVPGGSLIGMERVNNLGLMAERQNNLMLASLTTIVGVLIMLFAKETDATDLTTPSAPRSQYHPWVGKRDLTDDAYRIWLGDNYRITRNELFQKFVMANKTYDTLDAALLAAHEAEIEEERRAETQKNLDEELFREKLSQVERSTRRMTIALFAVAALVFVAYLWSLSR
ncbi:MAG: hypothetical protein DI554_00505 [Sphingobium sp.]|nr:MAG: hypothetical protein DI554_00505 [Sphingobium sp.]